MSLWIKLAVGDNAAALGVAMLKKAPGHFELKYHYQREMVEEKKIKFIKVGTKENTADLMTKAVEVVDFTNGCIRSSRE